MNSWDALIKSFLFLSVNHSINNFRNILSISVSIFTLGIYIIIILQFFSPKIKGKQCRVERFQNIELIRTMLFSFTLAFLQNNQIIQLILASIVNLGQLIILIFNKRLFNFPDFIMKLIIESNVSGVIILSFIYSQDLSGYFSNESKVQLAQFQMSILIVGVCQVFIKLIGEKLWSIKQHYSQKKQMLNQKNDIFI